MLPIIGRLYPTKTHVKIEQLMRYCKIQQPVDQYIGTNVVISVAVAAMFAGVLMLFVDLPYWLMFLAGIGLVNASIYAMLTLNADHRGQFVEEILPDVLQLMSANLRAGMTVDKSFLLAARPEFGPFVDEINTVGRQIATGKDLGEALMEMTTRIKSDRLRKTTQLIVTGLAAGGQLSDLMQETGANVREQKVIESRIRSSGLVYVIFIFSAIGFGAPLLFSLSTFLIEVITDIFSKVQLPTTAMTGTLPISFSKISVTPQFVRNYTLLSMTLTSFLGSLILGLVGKGKEREGLKYFPILMIMTLTLFFLIKFLISSLLSGLFNI